MTAIILTDGGSIVVDGINGMPGCVTGFSLNDDMPFDVHSIDVFIIVAVVVVLSSCLFYSDVFNKTIA